MIDRLVPRDRIAPLAVVAIGLTLLDGVATLAVVGTGLAVEANPVLAVVVDRLGIAPAMLLRVVVGSVLAWVLAWLSTWRREVRPALLVVALLLAVVAVVHVVGLAEALLPHAGPS